MSDNGVVTPGRYFHAVAVDYDGTLTTSGSPPPDVLAAIAETRADGRRVVLVTGGILAGCIRGAGRSRWAPPAPGTGPDPCLSAEHPGHRHTPARQVVCRRADRRAIGGSTSGRPVAVDRGRPRRSAACGGGRGDREGRADGHGQHRRGQDRADRRDPPALPGIAASCRGRARRARSRSVST
jgi:hypothetical protein